MKTYSSLDHLSDDLFMLLKLDRNNKGIPIIFTFQEGTQLSDIKLNRKSQLLTRVFSNNTRTKIFFETKEGLRSYWLLQTIPFANIIDLGLHENYKSNTVGYPDYKDKITFITNSLKESIPINQRKVFYFQFSEYVYLPGYSLSPMKIFKIDVSVQELCFDKSRNFIPTLIFYAKGKNNNKFYRYHYFPFHLLVNYKTPEEYLFESAHKSLHEKKENSNFLIKVKTSKTAVYKELIISSHEIPEKREDNYFPLLFILKFNKTNDRSHDNCLVCGTKLYLNEQLYVHLLSNGNLVLDTSTKIPNHFNFFPVGKECLSLVPKEFLFTEYEIKSQIKRFGLSQKD